MKKQAHTLTLRISKDVLEKLRQTAQDNYCSVSDIVRDLLTNTVTNTKPVEEHNFVLLDPWVRAVRTRDQGVCRLCGTEDDTSVYPLVPREKGGHYTLSNGQTLCFACYRQQYPIVSSSYEHASIYDKLPHGWLNKYRKARDQGKIFWERHLACFLTRRKRTISPIVEWYAETFLREVPEEVIIQTLIELCPSPDIIAAFPSRRYTSTDEVFNPPTLIWNGREG